MQIWKPTAVTCSMNRAKLVPLGWYWHINALPKWNREKRHRTIQCICSNVKCNCDVNLARAQVHTGIILVTMLAHFYIPYFFVCFSTLLYATTLVWIHFIWVANMWFGLFYLLYWIHIFGVYFSFCFSPFCLRRNGCERIIFNSFFFGALFLFVKRSDKKRATHKRERYTHKTQVLPELEQRQLMWACV